MGTLELREQVSDRPLGTRDPVTDGVMDSVAGTVAELLFSVVPLLILFLVHAYQQDLRNVWSSPEWALTAAVLFGQTVAKVTAGAISASHIGRVSGERVTLAVVLVIVLGLIPSLAVLMLLYVTAAPPPWLVVAQFVMLVLSVPTYFVFGYFGDWREKMVYYKHLIEQGLDHVQTSESVDDEEATDADST